ncbi:MAG TPA: SMC-Scp complex subunit ScpB [Candidatus Acidoferrum sp.]|jgi:segregation and condensation protein B|nr:SMC-Scp complex subunit ScpB [Candidatus Acidoferrum sp.]
MTNEERKAALEAIIYAADEPATIDQLATALGDEKLAVQSSLDELVASYASEDHGIEIREVAGGFKLYTKPQQHDVVRRFIKSLRPPLRLTMPALETLAVISYKQPVTGPEIGEIRGVNTSGVLKTLLDKRLITTAGRKEVIGRPILYRTSKEFLMRFGLSDLGELPSLKEFEALAREALGSDEGVVPDELPTDELDEVLDSPENTGIPSESEPASDGVNHDRENPLDPFGDTFASNLDGAHMTTKNIPDNQSDENEEIAAEVNATGEGMPAGEIDEAPRDPEVVQSPNAFDEENNRKNLAPTGKNTDKPGGESKGVAAGE